MLWGSDQGDCVRDRGDQGGDHRDCLPFRRDHSLIGKGVMGV